MAATLVLDRGVFTKGGVAQATIAAAITGTGIPTGNRVIVKWVGSDSTTTATTSVADSKGNTYTLRRAFMHGGASVAIYDATITTALTTSDTITHTQSGTTGANGILFVEEWNSDLGAFIAADHIGNTASQTITTPSVAASGPAVFTAVAGTSRGSSIAATATGPAGWTFENSGESGGATRKWGGSWWKVETSAVTQAFTATVGTGGPSGTGSAAIAAYESTTAATPGTVAHIEHAALSTTSLSVTAKVSAFTTAELVVSTNSGLTSPTYFTGAVDSDGWFRGTATGLTAGTLYYVAVADTPSGGSRTVVSETGKCRTLRTGTTGFTFAVGSCTSNNATDGLAHTDVATWAPDFLLHLGDFHYRNPTETTVGPHLGYREAQAVGATGLKTMLRDVPTYQVQSDHDDGPGDNLDSTGSSTVAAIAAYEKYASAQPLLADVRSPKRGRYYSFVQGRVRFIVMDVRTLDRSPGLDPQTSGKTMLGATQKAWVKARLLDPEPVKVLVSDVAWMGPTSPDADLEANAQDKWWAYANERQELADYIVSNGVRVLLVHGDSHLLGAGTRASNTWGGFPVWCCSPFANVGGGRYTTYFDNASYNTLTSRGSQYGRMTVTDTGSSIAIQYVGRDATNATNRFTVTETWDLAATATGSLPVTVGMVGAAVSVKATTGSLPVVVGMTGVAVPVKRATASLPVVVGFTGVAVAVKPATGALGVALGMTSTTSAVRSATGSLPLVVGFSAAVGGVVETKTATGSLPLTVALTCACVSVKATTGNLPLGVALTGLSVPVKATTGALPLTLGLTATTGTTRTTTGELVILVGLTGTAAKIATTTGVLTVNVGFAGTARQGNSETPPQRTLVVAAENRTVVVAPRPQEVLA